MAPRDRVTAAAILYDKERIERGLSGDDSRPLVLVIRGDNAQVMVGPGPKVDRKYPVDDAVDVTPASNPLITQGI
jgi:hypothetical protein